MILRGEIFLFLIHRYSILLGSRLGQRRRDIGNRAEEDKWIVLRRQEATPLPETGSFIIHGIDHQRSPAHQTGRLDATLQDAVQAEIGFLKTPRGAGFEFVGKDLVDPKILGTGAGIGMRKEDTDLKAKIDKAIAEIIKDGTYKKLEQKYFDFDVYGS